MDKAINQPEARKAGVYAIIMSDEWGNRELFYIGQAKELGQRITQHYQELSHALTQTQLANRSIYMGVIYSLDNVTNDIKPSLNDIESLFISRFQPQGNKTAKQRYSGKSIIIINTGKLPPYKDATFPKIMSHDAELLKQLKKAFINDESFF